MAKITTEAYASATTSSKGGKGNQCLRLSPQSPASSAPQVAAYQLPPLARKSTGGFGSLEEEEDATGVLLGSVVITPSSLCQALARGLVSQVAAAAEA
jgi:hypothetical protein